MKKFLFSLALSCLCVGIYAQKTDLSLLLNDCRKVEQTISNVFYFDVGKETIKLNQMSGLLSKDVFCYYNLTQYDTELKRNVFIKSEKHAQYYAAMLQDFNKVKQDKYYFRFSLRYNHGKEYNLTQKAFFFQCWLNEVNYASIPGYINLGGLCVSYPQNLITVKTYDHRNGMQYIQSFKASIKDESIALKIEENMNDCSILFIIKLEKSTKRQTGLFAEDFILAKTDEIYIVNNRTGEIYINLTETIFPTR